MGVSPAGCCVLYLRAFHQSGEAAALLVGTTIDDGNRVFTSKNDGFPSIGLHAVPDKAVQMENKFHENKAVQLILQ
jgi:hypothetical protein